MKKFLCGFLLVALVTSCFCVLSACGDDIEGDIQTNESASHIEGAPFDTQSETATETVAAIGSESNTDRESDKESESAVEKDTKYDTSDREDTEAHDEGMSYDSDKENGFEEIYPVW